MWANAQHDGRPAESMVDIQSPTVQIRRGKQRTKKEEDRRNHRMKI